MATKLSLDSNKPIILVDGSYFVFHRFFATVKWYKFREKNIKDDECMAIEELCTAIKKHALADLCKIRKKWASPAEGKNRISKKDWESIPVWFAMDCPRSNIWRSKFIDNYKGTRDVNRRPFDPKCFEILYECLTKEVPILGIEELEADDVIALTHKTLRELGYSGKIICITNDNDYLQLMDDNTVLYNLDDRDIGSRGCCDPKKDLLFKILLGDKSDNIPPVKSKINEKKLKELANLTEEEIIKSLELNEEEHKLMLLNRKLIDFSMIPGDLVEKYNMTYQLNIM